MVILSPWQPTISCDGDSMVMLSHHEHMVKVAKHSLQKDYMFVQTLCGLWGSNHVWLQSTKCTTPVVAGYAIMQKPWQQRTILVICIHM